MKPTETKTVEQFAFDGPFGLWLTLVVALLVLIVFFWMLSRERRILGSKTAVGFGALRLVAVGTVLWMLLAPTSVVVQTSSTRRTIAIMTDVSGSMGTVDPAGTADELRWLVARGGAPSSALGSSSRPLPSMQVTATESADQACAALGIARSELLATIDAIAQHRSEAIMIKHALAAQAAIQRATSRLESIRRMPLPIIDSDASLPSGDSPAGPSPGATSLPLAAWSMLSSPEFESYAKVCSMLAEGKVPSETGWRESLPDLEYRIVRARNAAQELARLLVQMETATTSRQDPSRWATIHRQSRLQRVAKVLEHVKHSTLDAIDADADVQWGQFDTTSKIASPISPNEELMTPPVAEDAADRSGLATNLSSALEHLRRLEQQQPVAAAFILSDVNHNDVGTGPLDESDTVHRVSTTDGINLRDPNELASHISRTPVYVVPIGNTRRLRDLALVAVEAPAVAMRNDDIVIEAHLEAYQCEGARCVVQLIADATVIDFREVEIDSDFVSRTVRFVQRVAEIGEQSFQIAIEPIDGETTAENNYDRVDVNVTRSDIKVLLADEMPRWEFRYLAQLFRRDPKVDCDEMLFRPRMIATGKREESQTFPTTVDQWDQYDVVILGDIPPEHLSVPSQESLVQYLRQRGGTLLTIAGQRAMPQAYVNLPLEDVIPVRPVDASTEKQSPGGDDGYAFRVTEQGKSHVALMIGETQQATRSAWDFVNRFSPLHEVSRWRKPKPMARNLIAAVPRGATADEASAEDQTFLCWQSIGRGRVVYLSGPDTYRLRFLRGDQLHFRFWGQLLRWAIASDLTSGSEYVRLRTDKTRYQAGESVLMEVQLFDAEGKPVIDAENFQLQLTSGDERRSVSAAKDPERPGVYIASFKVPQPGVYHAEPVGKAIDALSRDQADEAVGVSFTVQANLPLELIDTRCDRVLANQISDLTGGQVLPPTAISEIIAMTDLTPIMTETVQRKPLWDQWKYLWIVFGCLQLEWAVRKWRGLS